MGFLDRIFGRRQRKWEDISSGKDVTRGMSRRKRNAAIASGKADELARSADTAAGNEARRATQAASIESSKSEFRGAVGQKMAQHQVVIGNISNLFSGVGSSTQHLDQVDEFLVSVQTHAVSVLSLSMNTMAHSFEVWSSGAGEWESDGRGGFKPVTSKRKWDELKVDVDSNIAHLTALRVWFKESKSQAKALRYNLSAERRKLKKALDLVDSALNDGPFFDAQIAEIDQLLATAKSTKKHAKSGTRLPNSGADHNVRLVIDNIKSRTKARSKLYQGGVN